MHRITDIAHYLPHRPPFLLVDSIEIINEDHFISYTNPDDKVYLRNQDGVEEAFLIENIAQTCAASFGYLASASAGKPQIGFIGAVSKLTATEMPTKVHQIVTEVRVLQRFGSVILVEGRCSSASSDEWLRCEMKIVLVEE